ncbi:MAG TPA: hypothetical protein VFG79_19945 [Solirubrobacter sp.]|nr:hypothetical protein [Solirubrobacter sp.]
MDEIEEEGTVPLPSKEVMSLLDVNANVDLGLDLAAPVDLAVAANLNVAAPIEASAAANLLSPDAQAISYAHQAGTIDQGISGSAEATAPQQADISQDSNPEVGPTETGGEVSPGTTGAIDAGDAVGGATGAVEGATGDAVDGATGAVEGATGADVEGTTGDAVDGVTGEVEDTTGDATAGVDSLLNGGNLLDANVDINANANLTAPINGAVAANGNVAAPIDAAVAANIGSEHAVAEALAPQEVNINQQLDDVSAEATAEQDASIDQQ